MTSPDFSLSDFDYHLPKDLIAQQPANPRDHSRLLIYRRNDQSIRDDFFYNISRYLPEHSALVLNDSRVEKARMLFGSKEIFVTRIIDPYTIEALIRPGKRFRPGKKIVLTDFEHNPAFTEPVCAEVLHMAEDGLRIIRLNYPVDHRILDPYRHTPFPPYIAADEQLSERYQTIYAHEEGSKAAPTAGLHFTERVFSDLSEKSIQKIKLTLHVGLGTFAPVKAEHIKDHVMHSEWYRITPKAADALRSAQFITAVGTTTARILESAALQSMKNSQTLPPFRDFQPCEQETDIFITPGYSFRAMDALLTNFHLPKSTLLMMIAAFIGIDEMHRIYRHAINHQYRFYSFGDAMLLL